MICLSLTSGAKTRGRNHETHHALGAREKRELCRDHRRGCRCGRGCRKGGVETDPGGCAHMLTFVGIGLIIGSQRNVSCLFRGVSGEPDEPYTGTMTRVV